MEKTIAIIDLKSFYSSCECACRHLDIFKTPLVCCDPYRSGSSVVMSVTPFLKEKYGVPNVCRKRDLPPVKGMIFAVPRMSYYLSISAKIIAIYLKYVAKEDLHVYSVDESFLNLGPYLKMYGCGAEEIVRRIQLEIKERFGLIATAGIGPNMFLAKAALDNEGKKRTPYLARWDYKDVPNKLWKITPMSKIWSIGGRTEAHLKRIGIRDIESLANADERLLQKEFGIIGLQMKDLANGLDEANIQDKYIPQETSLSAGQVLKRPYEKAEASLLLVEMCDSRSRRLRKTSSMSKTITLWISYGDKGGFGKSRQLPYPTDDVREFYSHLKELFDGSPSLPIRAMGISFGCLSKSSYEQMSFLLDANESLKRKSLDRTLDEIKTMFGENSVLRCSSLLPSSTIHQRNEQIGGHRK